MCGGGPSVCTSPRFTRLGWVHKVTLPWRDFVIQKKMLFTRVFILRDVPNEVYQSLDAVGGDEKWWEVIYFDYLFSFVLP